MRQGSTAVFLGACNKVDRLLAIDGTVEFHVQILHADRFADEQDIRNVVFSHQEVRPGSNRFERLLPGTLKKKVAPLPGSDSTQILPP
jgi:hypothetical protein